jgi:D-3-phosphoglycerate dehydrogenase
VKIIVADDLPASALDLLRAEADWSVDARSGRSPAQLAADLVDADALLVRSATTVDARLLAGAARLRIVARAGTGVDNVDVEAASARGVLVVNAPGANSISVAEHTWALLLALARAVPAADRAMKERRWEKRRFLGTELRGKTLGIVGLGRIGREVAERARAFGLRVIAHDPFLAADAAAALGVTLLPIDELCAAADLLTLHLPSTPATRRLFDDARFSRCKPGVRLVNTARGDLIDPAALARAIDAGIVAGAGLDVFALEPPDDWSLVTRPEVVATPHIAASTEEAQELVGVEAAGAVRDFLRDGLVRNAVNFPGVGAEDMLRLQPWIRLADRLGALLSQIGPARAQTLAVRCYGALADSHGVGVVAQAAAAGVLRPVLSGGVSIVNARAVAAARGLEVVESRSSRPRDFASLLSLRLQTNAGERWVEGTVFEPNSPRLVAVGGVAVEAPLAGTLIVIANDDQPGVIGEVGTVLGRHGVNIATFALGRGPAGAIGVVNVDEDASGAGAVEAATADIQRIAAVRDAHVVRLDT